MANKVGIFVDAVNVTMNGGFGLRYDVLRHFACRHGCQPQCLNVYLAFDTRRAKEDSVYKEKTDRFGMVLRDFEYKVLFKPVQYYENSESDELTIKSTVDMDMAVDMLEHADGLDSIIFCTNNGSFVSIVKALQRKGVRATLVGFDDMPEVLRNEVDCFMPGYLIPGLLPIESPYKWGEVGSRVRGLCYDFSHEDGYGFIRYLDEINEHIWITDSRLNRSPYKTVFAHISQFESNFDTSYLPSRNLIFELDLVKNDKGLFAENIKMVSAS